MATLSFSDLEKVYERLATAIDAAGPEHEALFLTKLAILQAQRTGDPEAFFSAVETALKDLPKS